MVVVGPGQQTPSFLLQSSFAQLRLLEHTDLLFPEPKVVPST